MSYIKVKNISIKKSGEITINGASNNCRPITYSTFDYKGNTKELLLSILDGSLQLNDSVYKWNYAYFKMIECFGKEKYRELKDDIDNWKWNFKDVKRMYVVGYKLSNRYIELSQEEYNNRQNEFVEIDRGIGKSSNQYVLYMEREQHDDLKNKFDNALTLMHDTFFKYLNEKDTDKEYYLYSNQLRFIKKTKSRIHYSSSLGYVKKETYKKIYCDYQNILTENKERYNIIIKQHIEKQAIETKNGYSAYRVDYVDILKWGGYGVCDLCNNDMLNGGGYLVYILNSCVCPSCFDNWLKDSKLYNEDKKQDEQNSNEWYKKHYVC